MLYIEARQKGALGHFLWCDAILWWAMLRRDHWWSSEGWDDVSVRPGSLDSMSLGCEGSDGECSNLISGEEADSDPPTLRSGVPGTTCKY
ncbi:hypothetical protein J6590_040302 [Homalodisca vitripennis]|nr:hypothetical protein J6590_040302 [Homalodisca vitripennis]